MTDRSCNDSALFTRRSLDRATWLAASAQYRSRADSALDAFGTATDPVLDFLFTYYTVRPGSLRRWHPGYGIVLRDAPEFASLTHYRTDASGSQVSDSLLDKRRPTVEYIADLLRATTAQPANLRCFGLHEWAMLYRDRDSRRHEVPLRLGQEGTDTVVETMELRCTHFDAYRFFTPAAAPRNANLLTREFAPQFEQPGCLHANMDLYKWTTKLGVLAPADLTLDCFELAIEARTLDMRASPYDLSTLGYAAVPIETAAGRAEYVRAQGDIAGRAATLRQRLLNTCIYLLSA